MKKIHVLRIIIIPLIFFEFLFFNFAIGPIHITSLRVFLAIALFTLFFALFSKKINLPTSNYTKYASFFLYFWLLYSIFQLLYVQDFISAINNIFYLLIYFSIILCYSTISDKKEWKLLINIITWIGVIIIFICIWEIITKNHLPTSRIFIDDIVKERISTGIFYNENDLGLFFVMIFPLVYYNNLIYFKLVKPFILFCITVIIVLNSSKAALISLIIQSLFMILFSEKSKRWKIRIYTFFALLGLVFLSQIINFFSPIVSQILDAQGSTYLRLDVYIKGLKALRESYYLGVGPGNFESALIEMFGKVRIINPHNWWIELLVNSGVVLFSLYLVFFVGMIIKALKIYKENMKENKLILAIAITFIGFIVGSIGPSSTFDKTFIWLFYGMGLGVINIFSNKRPINDEQGSIT